MENEKLNRKEENIKTNRQIEESLSFISHSPVYKQKLQEQKIKNEEDKRTQSSDVPKRSTAKRTAVTVKKKNLSGSDHKIENNHEDDDDINSYFPEFKGIKKESSFSYEKKPLPEFDYQLKTNKRYSTSHEKVSHEKVSDQISKHEKPSSSSASSDSFSFEEKEMSLSEKMKMIKNSISVQNNQTSSFSDPDDDEFDDGMDYYAKQKRKTNPERTGSYDRFKNTAAAGVAMKNRKPVQLDESETDAEGKNKSSSVSSSVINKSTIITIILAAVLVIALGAVYTVGYIGYKGRYLKNTFVNGVDISGMKIGEADDAIAASANDSGITIVKKGGEKVHFDGSQYGCKFFVPENANYGAEKHKFWFTKYFHSTNYNVELEGSYSENALRALIRNYTWGSTESVNAYLEKKDDGTYDIVDDIQGDMIDNSVFSEYVIQQVANGEDTINIDDAGCYIPAEITSSDLQDELDLCNATGNMTVTINFGDEKEIIDSDKLSSWVSLNDKSELEIDKEAVLEYVETLSEKYNTYGKDRKFRATVDGDIVVPWTATSNYGWKINQETMVSKITEAIKTMNKEPISPSFQTFGYKDYSTDDIGKTYIEVDLSEQHFWLYKNGEIVLEDNVVTGLASDPERVTPPGIYSVWQMIPGKYLGTYDVQGYHTWVDYWMAVTYTGIGFHDLSRGAYGGTIYLTNGSHGCINLSKSTAQALYESIEVGIPVVMHE